MASNAVSLSTVRFLLISKLFALDLREDAFSSEATARFHVAPNGSVANVELIKPCQNPRLNNLLLKSLKNWKFESSTAGFTQDIRVTFSVE